LWNIIFHCSVDEVFPQFLWNSVFHESCGIQISTEFVGNNISVEFGLPGVNEFTLAPKARPPAVACFALRKNVEKC